MARARSLIAILAAASLAIAAGPFGARADARAARPVKQDRTVATPYPVPAAQAPRAWTPPPARQTDPRWAVLIGIDDYPGGSQDLAFRVSDAHTTLRALLNLGFPRSHIRVLTNGEATGGAILRYARWLAARTGPGATGVFLYSGHAARVVAGDGDGEAVDEAMIGSDAAKVTDTQLARALRPATGRMWLLFANCYAAGFGDAAAQGRVFSFASPENAYAYESSDIQASFMIEFVVEHGMLRAGKTTVERAFRAGTGEMTGYYQRFQPLITDRVPGSLSLLRPRTPVLPEWPKAA